MERSTGVTLSAVVVFFGSAMAFLGGLFMVAALKFAPHRSIPIPLLRGALIFDGALDLAFVAWGIASGVGLIRLRQWARISILVFSGIMIVLSLIPMLIIPFVPLQVGAAGTEADRLPPNFGLFFRLGVVVFYGFFVALGAFWLYFFNKRSVKDQFKGISTQERPAAQLTLQKPLAIVILAWLLIIGGCFTPAALLMRVPVFFFSFALAPHWGGLFYGTFALLSVVAGIGLLRLRRWGWVLAVAIQSIGLLNALSMILIPGASARFQEMLRVTQAAAGMPDAPIVFPPAVSMWIGLGIGTLVAGAILAILFWYKHAFSDQPSTPAPAI